MANSSEHPLQEPVQDSEVTTVPDHRLNAKQRAAFERIVLFRIPRRPYGNDHVLLWKECLEHSRKTRYPDYLSNYGRVCGDDDSVRALGQYVRQLKWAEMDWKPHQ